MITRNEKAKGLWWRLLATIPVLAVLVLSNVRASAQQVTQSEQMVYETKTSEITDVKVNKADNDTVFQICEVMPEFPGGTEKFMAYLSENIKYPEEAKDKNISGRVFINFVVEKDGSVSNVKVMRSIGGGCDEEAVRVVKAMPKWKPGMQRGKPVRVSYVLPVTFKLNENQPKTAEEKVENTEVKPDKDGVWPMAEEMPEYPGGMEAMKQYISDNLVVPEKYKEMDAKAEYRVLIRFVVAEDGSITQVETVKPEPAKKDLNDEAVRVVKGMPKWIPGKVEGKPVKVKYVLPILFKLGK